MSSVENKIGFYLFGFHFTLQTSYYILRPLRDSFSLTVNSQSASTLPSAYVLSFFICILLVFITSNRDRLKSYKVYVGIGVVLSLFSVWQQILNASLTNNNESIARLMFNVSFIVAISSLNLLLMAVFWTTAVECLGDSNLPQGAAARWLPTLSSAGTFGSFVGPMLSVAIVNYAKQDFLLPLATILIFLTAWFAFLSTQYLIENRRLNKNKNVDNIEKENQISSLRKGRQLIFESSFLKQLTLFMASMTISATILYFQFLNATKSFSLSKIESISYFASIDFIVNISSLSSQFILSRWLIHSISFKSMLFIVPITTLIGFIFTSLTFDSLQSKSIILFFILRRALNFSVLRTCRELLWIDQKESRGAKLFIDVIIYRLGDIISAWIYNLLSIQFSQSIVVLLFGVGICLLWLQTASNLSRHKQNDNTTSN